MPQADLCLLQVFYQVPFTSQGFLMVSSLSHWLGSPSGTSLSLCLAPHCQSHPAFSRALTKFCSLVGGIQFFEKRAVPLSTSHSTCSQYSIDVPFPGGRGCQEDRAGPSMGNSLCLTPEAHMKPHGLLLALSLLGCLYFEPSTMM